MSPVKKGVLAALFLSVGAGSVLHHLYTRTPTYSLIKTVQAVSEHDLATFEKHVDIEGVLGGLIDHTFDFILEDAQAKMASNRSSADPLARALGKGLSQGIGKGLIGMIKSPLLGAGKTMVSDYIENGNLDIPNIGSVSPVALGAGLGVKKALSKIMKDQADGFLGIDFVEKKGKIAYVGLKFHIKEYDVPMIVKLRMRDRGGYWQVAEVSNFKDLISEIDALEGSRVKKLNAGVIAALPKTLVLKKFGKENAPVPNNRFTGKVVFTFTFENLSDKRIESFTADVSCGKEGGTVLLEFPLRKTVGIPPSSSIVVVEEKDLLMMLPQHAELFGTRFEDLDLTATVKYVKFADGTELKLEKKRTDLAGMIGNRGGF